MRLGKQDYQFDAKTLKMARMISPSVTFPLTYDLDTHRARFPLLAWGNREWGNCVKAAQINEILRLERLEQRRTVRITEEMVVDEYKKQTGSQTPGDSRDVGLVMLTNNRLWRKAGFPVKTHAYQIAAFGELDPSDTSQLRAAIYLLHGVQFGFALPEGIQDNVHDGAVWDVYASVNGDPRWRPGSWGGHAVYSKAYDTSSFEILTWGFKVRVTDAFVRRYCDEAWAVVDNFNNWRRRPEIDVNSIIQHLRDIGASGIE